MSYIPFAVCNYGKCDDCGDTKRLDTMVKKLSQKGRYRCIDCETEAYSHEFVRNQAARNNFFETDIQDMQKFERVISWLCG